MDKEIKERIETINNGNVPTELIKSEIGLLPVDWATVTLNDIADALTQTAGKESYETVSISAGIGFVNQAKKFGKELSGKQYEKYIVLHKGDFSYNKGNSKTYPQGCIYRLKKRETAAVPNVFESFRIKSGCADYYDQLFTSGFLNKQLSRKINHGVRDDGLLNLTGKDFYSCVLPLPPVEEQDKIAEILSHCDNVIEECEKQVEEYKSLKKTCLSKMFPKKGSNVPEIRFPGFTDDWEQRKFGEVLETVTDYVAAGSFADLAKNVEYKDSPDYAQLVRTMDLKNGFTSSQEIYVDKKAFNYLYRVNMDKECIILPNIGNCGEVYYVKPENLPYEHNVLGPNAIFVQSETNANNFLSILFQSKDFQSKLKLIVNPNGQTKFNKTELKGIDLILPNDLDEQIKIGEYFSNLDNLITLHQRKADEYKKMKKALTQLLLTGIVRVNKQQEISQ